MLPGRAIPGLIAWVREMSLGFKDKEPVKAPGGIHDSKRCYVKTRESHVASRKMVLQELEDFSSSKLILRDLGRKI